MIPPFSAPVTPGLPPWFFIPPAQLLAYSRSLLPPPEHPTQALRRPYPQLPVEDLLTVQQVLHQAVHLWISVHPQPNHSLKRKKRAGLSLRTWQAVCPVRAAGIVGLSCQACS